MVLQKELDTLENHMDKMDVLNAKVSKREVAWHIDHSLRVINGICNALTHSDPAEYESRFNLSKMFFLGIGWFPRGKVRAPKAIMNHDSIDRDELIALFTKVKSKLSNIASLPVDTFFVHPVFGKLNRAETPKFLRMHTNHHLKIIRDILK